MIPMTAKLTPEEVQSSGELANMMVDACNTLPPVCGVAALIAVTGAVCFNEAEGDVTRALKRAESIALGVKNVIDKLHQEEVGNGHEGSSGICD
jgi:hypothetical protein